MARRRINVSPDAVEEGHVVPGDGLEAAFDAVRAEMKVPAGFPEDVLEEARAAVAAPRLPDRDETDLPLLTIDPPGSMDLDQAMHIAREGSGYRVRYAIADLPAFLVPDGPMDKEAWQRGQTVYLPDGRAPLHPPTVSEGGASLLPGRERPAYLWDMRLDAQGRTTDVQVHRAMVRSVDRFDYEQVQRRLDEGAADERLGLLREVGERRIALERERGGAGLPMPEQEVTLDERGRYRIGFRPLVPVEEWNAQISLMTGMAAAEMMLRGRVGILRTMPEADQEVIARFRRQTRALGVPWPAETSYGDFLRTLDRTNPRHLALIHDATMLFRGAGYTPFDGALPEQTEQAAVAAPYAHVTAPLRRLVDRFGLAVCEALSSGADVPDWARTALPALPEVMERSDQLAGAVDRACLNVVEAAALRTHVGETFPGTVVELRGDDECQVQVEDPAILAPCAGRADLGEEVRVRLVEADLEQRVVRFELAGPAAGADPVS